MLIRRWREYPRRRRGGGAGTGGTPTGRQPSSHRFGGPQRGDHLRIVDGMPGPVLPLADGDDLAAAEADVPGAELTGPDHSRTLKRGPGLDGIAEHGLRTRRTERLGIAADLSLTGRPEWGRATEAKWGLDG